MGWETPRGEGPASPPPLSALHGFLVGSPGYQLEGPWSAPLSACFFNYEQTGGEWEMSKTTRQGLSDDRAPRP